MLLQHGSLLHLNEGFVHCTFEFQTVSIMGTSTAVKVSKLHFISQCVFFLDEVSGYLTQLEFKCLHTSPLLEKTSHELYGLYGTQNSVL